MGVDVSVQALAAAFDQHLAPACRQPQADYWRAWRLVVTWAVARNVVPDILPMSLETLKASRGTSYAPQFRHRRSNWFGSPCSLGRHCQFQLSPPMSEANQFTSWARMLGSIRGRPNLNLSD